MSRHAVAALLMAVTAGGAAAGEKARYAATVHNTNMAQNFSRVVLVVHDSQYRLFELGQAASEPLARLAEDGDPGGFEELPHCCGALRTIVGPAVPRGRSISIDLPLDDTGDSVVSAAAMLTLTNDGFVAAVNLSLPREIGHTIRAALYAYDAGSEANTESCAHMPCGEHGHRMTRGAEGSVSLHPGIRGGGDIPPHRAWNDQVLGWVEVTRAE